MEKEKDQGVKGRPATVKPVNGTRAVSGATNDSFGLQRTLGNQEMQRLLKSGGVQAKLRASQPGDADEQEADHAAEHQAKHPGERPRTLIVEDDAPSLGPGQMRKQEFVTLLQTTTCATADAVLESVGHTTKGCPYIKKWLEHYKDKDAQHLMRAMRLYPPAAA